MSFHASSRLILHADVSYIIDIACHWSYFSNITSFSYFLDRQNPVFFFPFPTPNFCRTGTRRTYVHPFDRDYWAKTRYQPIFRHCLGAVLQYLTIFYENLHYLEIWAENRENFNKVGDVLDPETEEQMLVMCAWVCASVSWPHDVMNI